MVLFYCLSCNRFPTVSSLAICCMIELASNVLSLELGVIFFATAEAYDCGFCCCGVAFWARALAFSVQMLFLGLSFCCFLLIGLLGHPEKLAG
ncbi:hypothetical protein TNIN_143041 [Trichonephila inaurata madagascariensis]|uniref:Uncharacterized protein n=1 Tax=Trichonephila inaurata madagascariensis TaxID=2747483 RepID=A0A8X6MJE0_9ARAC|nr:hypothetical protein TNIN_143041 [Trichonephila inaurata madagascariensis]